MKIIFRIDCWHFLFGVSKYSTLWLLQLNLIYITLFLIWNYEGNMHLCYLVRISEIFEFNWCHSGTSGHVIHQEWRTTARTPPKKNILFCSILVSSLLVCLVLFLIILFTQNFSSVTWIMLDVIPNHVFMAGEWRGYFEYKCKSLGEDFKGVNFYERGGGVYTPSLVKKNWW